MPDRTQADPQKLRRLKTQFFSLESWDLAASCSGIAMLEQKGSPDLNKSPLFWTSQGFTSAASGTKGSLKVPARKEQEGMCLPEHEKIRKG